MNRFLVLSIVIAVAGILQFELASSSDHYNDDDDDHHDDHHDDDHHQPSSRDQLVTDLLHHYHESVEPSGLIELKFGLSLLCVRFDKEHSKLKTSAWEHYEWNDFRLSWDPKDYDGISHLTLPDDLIWKPDIDCYNAIEEEERSSENIDIDHDGHINWIPRAYYKTLCHVENDKPVCELSFGSWTYDRTTLHLELDHDGVDLGAYLNETCPYDVDSHTAHKDSHEFADGKEPHASLDISLHISPHGDEEKKTPAV